MPELNFHIEPEEINGNSVVFAILPATEERLIFEVLPLLDQEHTIENIVIALHKALTEALISKKETVGRLGFNTLANADNVKKLDLYKLVGKAVDLWRKKLRIAVEGQ